ncbi:MAG: hypothetical protein Q4C00_03560 [Bacillota bacterium]|nr:hypothetical protein [Bacillota bacterium]
MENNADFQQVALELRCLTTTLENLQGQIFSDSYRQGSLMIFRAMVLREELAADFSQDKFVILKEMVADISDFIEDIIRSPEIFDTYLQ